MALSPTVRIEDGFSLGRSYSTMSSWREVRAVPGLGAQRRALTTRSFQPYAAGGAPVLEATTMALANLRASTRAEVLAYFRNTWALSDTLFSALKTDASFYMVPDKLRRPLIFYFGHPAALYINKMHQAGLVGASCSAGDGGAKGGAQCGRRERERFARGRATTHTRKRTQTHNAPILLFPPLRRPRQRVLREAVRDRRG